MTIEEGARVRVRDADSRYGEYIGRYGGPAPGEDLTGEPFEFGPVDWHLVQVDEPATFALYAHTSEFEPLLPPPGAAT